LDDGKPWTDAMLNSAAVRYNTDGTMPPLGAGRAAGRKRDAILERASLLDPTADIAGNRAVYRADASTLATLERSRASIQSFEQTAQKNIDIFLKQAEKVSDTGIPVLNAPVRWASGQVLGSTDQAAYSAARQVALTEIARIITNPNLSGVLTDSARQEVEEFNPRSAPLAQTVAIMKVLKQDMTNRTESLGETIADVRKRLKARQTGAAPPPPAGAGGGPGPGRATGAGTSGAAPGGRFTIIGAKPGAQ
jgi:hypothetical protein